MSSETAHIQLREHLGNDGESFKIVKEVMGEVEPDTDNVVFFMELVTEDEKFQGYIDQANRGEISYREAFLRAEHPELANDEEYPLVKSLSHNNWGKQITNLVYLRNMDDNSNPFAWTRMVYDRFNTTQASDIEFRYSRAGEYDRLKAELKAKGKNFTVVIENGSAFVKKVTEVFGQNPEQDPVADEDELRGIIRSSIQSFAILTMGRDEMNAQYIRERISKLKGKTEVFTHFGTLHQGLPKAWQDQGFKIVVEEANTFGYMKDVYSDVDQYLQQKGVSCWDLVKDKQYLEELVEIVYERRQVGALAMVYIDKVGMDLTYRKQVDFYDRIMETVKDYSPEDQARIIRKWLEDLSTAH